MSEKEKTYVNDLAQYLHRHKEMFIKKTESKDDLFELMLFKILQYSTGKKDA